MDFAAIKAFAFDVDGVFTDGGILCDTAGELYRTFDAKDGFAIRMARMKQYPVAIITGGRSVSIRERFLTSGVDPDDIYLGARDKTEQMTRFCARHGLTPQDVLYVGDDLPDIALLAGCGLPVCPSDAVPEVKAVCRYVSPCPGGKGCVRDIVERVMKARGDWTFDTQLYKKLF